MTFERLEMRSVERICVHKSLVYAFCCSLLSRLKCKKSEKIIHIQLRTAVTYRDEI